MSGVWLIYCQTWHVNVPCIQILKQPRYSFIELELLTIQYFPIQNGRYLINDMTISLYFILQSASPCFYNFAIIFNFSLPFFCIHFISFTLQYNCSLWIKEFNSRQWWVLLTYHAHSSTLSKENNEKRGHLWTHCGSYLECIICVIGKRGKIVTFYIAL